jgi:hypothetical protein
MNSFLDNALVGLVLLASASYAVASLGPRSLRKRFLALLSRVLTAAPGYLGLGRAARKLEAASMLKAQGACGGCDNCGSEQAPTAPASAVEIKIPVGEIGRRV